MSLTEQCQNHTTITQKNLGTIRLIKQKNQEFRKDPAPSSKLQNKISLASPQNTVTNTSQYITNICPHTRPSPKKRHTRCDKQIPVNFRQTRPLLLLSQPKANNRKTAHKANTHQHTPEFNKEISKTDCFILQQSN